MNPTINSSQLNPTDAKTNSKYLFIIGVLFFVFGFVTWLGSVLIPYLKITCQLNNIAAYLVAFSFYISYLLLALPSAALLKKTGFKNGMVVGLLLISLGTLLFIPAAKSRIFLLFLVGQFIQGSGLAILQTAANPYVVMLGPRKSAAKRISIMGICNGIAGIIAPIILGAIILNDADQININRYAADLENKSIVLQQIANKVIAPYAFMTILLLLIAFFIYRSGLPEIDPEKQEEDTPIKNDLTKTSVFQFPHLMMGVVSLFLYVGVEVIAGDSIILYGASQGIALSTAKFFTSFTLSGMLIGYLIGIIAIPRFLSQEKALQISAILGIIFCLLALATNGKISLTFIALLGLANALIYPSIWPLALNGLGSFTKIGSSLLIMAIGGGAILPLIYGRIADHFSPHQAYWMVIPCYLVILFYAVRGHKLVRK
jgi:FHS family L-fucose permease-like MFS transporter